MLPASEIQKTIMVNLVFPRETDGRLLLPDRRIAAVSLSCRVAVNHMLASASSRDAENPIARVEGRICVLRTVLPTAPHHTVSNRNKTECRYNIPANIPARVPEKAMRAPS